MIYFTDQSVSPDSAPFTVSGKWCGANWDIGNIYIFDTAAAWESYIRALLAQPCLSAIDPFRRNRLKNVLSSAGRPAELDQYEFQPIILPRDDFKRLLGEEVSEIAPGPGANALIEVSDSCYNASGPTLDTHTLERLRSIYSFAEELGLIAEISNWCRESGITRSITRDGFNPLFQTLYSYLIGNVSDGGCSESSWLELYMNIGYEDKAILAEHKYWFIALSALRMVSGIGVVPGKLSDYA